MGTTTTKTSTRAAILFLLAHFLTCAVDGQEVETPQRPNILFVLMDDMGWGDVGFRDKQFHTPTIDRLYAEGVRFNQSYTPPNCGASRAALLSGIYPWRMGLQGNAINSRSPAAIPTSKKILPQKLKEDLGYQTHLVGKWHQGFCKVSQLPTSRGFDTFYGFYLTKQDHFTHVGKKEAYDFRNNQALDRSVEGQYSTYIYSERTRKLIEEYKHLQELEPASVKPFFILLSYAAIHGPNQVPQEYVDAHCLKISDPERQKKCGMMAAVDEGLKNITDDLKSLGLEENTLIIFTSDDGGKTDEGSSNWPLRGAKRTLWEGGIRVNTFMYSKSKKILPKRSFTWEGLFYMTDFYATLVGLIENDTKTKRLRKVKDSLNHWGFLKAGAKGRSYRRGFSYVDQELGVAMTRDRNLKLLYSQSRYPGWYNPPRGVKAIEEPSRSRIPEYQLFDLREDPTETTNLVDLLPEEFKKLQSRLSKARSKAKKPITISLDSSPSKFKDVWSTGWCKKSKG